MLFNDAYVRILAKGVLESGEELLGQTVVAYKPWWAFGLIRSQSLLLATSARLVLLEFRYRIFSPMDQDLREVDSFAWSNVQEVKVKGLLKKKLRLSATGARGPVRMTRGIPSPLFLSPMKNNLAGARSVASTFDRSRSQALPVGAYGQPQLPAAAAMPGGVYSRS